MNFARWASLLLALTGGTLIALIVIEDFAEQSVTASWLVTYALAAERIGPLLGLGAALGLVGRRPFLLALGLFGIGIALGFACRDELLALMGLIPGAERHMFHAGAMSFLAAALPLVAPQRWRPWLVHPAAILMGAMLALAITLTDPSVDDATIAVASVAIGLWAVLTVALLVRSFRQRWFTIASRILGSWLLAIGLLYGGASLITRQNLPSPPQPQTAREPVLPKRGPETLFPPSDQPGPSFLRQEQEHQP